MSGLQCYGETLFLQGLSPEQIQKICYLTEFPSSNISADKATLGKLSIRSTDGLYSLSGRGQPDVEFQPIELLAEILKVRMILKIALAKPELLFLRGDVVRVPNGSAILIAGPSISGKSRLAQAFLDQGASSWATGTAVLNSRGELLPFPYAELPLSGPAATAIASIVYENQADWEPELLTPGQVVLKLTSAIRTSSELRPDDFSRLGQVATQAKLRCGGRRGDPAKAVDFFYQNLDLG